MGLLKIVFLVLLVVGIGILLINCGSGGNTRIRVFNALDATSPPTLDVYFNGTREITALQFGSVYPTQATPAAYISVPSGKDTIQAYDTGSQSNPFYGANGFTASPSGGSDYTLVLSGTTTSPNPPLLLTDNSANSNPPTQGNFEVRVINASQSSSNYGGIGYSIYQTGQTVPAPTGPVSVMEGTNGYVSFPFISGQTYNLRVFYGGTQQAIFTYAFTPGGSSTAGEIDTFVVFDNPSGGINSFPVKMVDLN